MVWVKIMLREEQTKMSAKNLTLPLLGRFYKQYLIQPRILSAPSGINTLYGCRVLLRQDYEDILD